jgi:lysozyme family protein/peptidoglycan hydrolase-like protein with peptidoglycan-binding domain
MKEPMYSSRWPQLAKLWDTATIINQDEVAAVAKRLVAAKARYQSVEAGTGVPWWLIAGIHEREASQNWNTQLAQGDPLHEVSVHVPRGMGPFDTWEEGAIAALKHEGMISVSDWDLEKALHWQEKYNGWGYFFRGIPSPYVWGATSVQRPGKFVSDGVWSPTTMDRQTGCAAILKGMMALDPSIKPVRESDGAGVRGIVVPPGPTPSDSTQKGTGAGLLSRAQKHIGEEYVNIQVPKDNANWTGPWDCAEFMSWLVYQEAGILFGCVDDNAKPFEADAYTGAWQTDVEKRGIRVSVDQAASTVGGMLLRFPPPGGMGHIVLCDGKGGTVEAKGRKFGVVADTVHGRGWDIGLLIPGITYDNVTGVTPVKPPADLYARNVPNMDSAIITRIQQALATKGFSPGDIDGDFGPETEAAVVAFQLSAGLVADGEVGRETAGALEISLTGEKPAEKPPEVAKPIPHPPADSRPIEQPSEPVKPFPSIISNVIPKIIPGLLLGIGNPFIGLAAAVLPDILKAVVSDKAGAVAGAVTQAVADITQTQNPEEARNKLNTDPAAVAALQLKLAEIAAAQEEKRQQGQLTELKEQNAAQLAQLKEQNGAQLAQLKEQNEQEAKRREAQLAELRADMADTKDARSSFSALALANNPMAWGAPLVSFIVTLGFFGILVLLIMGFMKQADQLVAQIINITIGALAAAFATVVSFWLGSSQGSRSKDAATLQLQADQASQTNAALQSQARQAEVLKTTVEAQAKHAEALQSTVTSAMAAKPVIGVSKPSNFRRCVDLVIAQEGRFSDNPSDPSAATQFGLTLRDLRESKQNQNLTVDDLRKLGRDDACEIYRTRYWNVLRCDDLPTGVDLVVFDGGVDAGASRSAMMLQQVVGAAADGSIGDATIAATKAMSPTDVVNEVSNRRLEYYRDPANAPNVIRDGTNRTTAIEKAALDMIAAERAGRPGGL